MSQAEGVRVFAPVLGGRMAGRDPLRGWRGSLIEQASRARGICFHAPHRGAPTQWRTIRMLQYALKELIRRRSRSLLLLFGLIVVLPCSRPLSLSHGDAQRGAPALPIGQCRSRWFRRSWRRALRSGKTRREAGGIPGRRSRRSASCRGWRLATGVLELWATSGLEETDRAVVTGLVPEDQHRIGARQAGRGLLPAGRPRDRRAISERGRRSCLSRRETVCQKHGLGARRAGDPWAASRSPSSARWRPRRERASRQARSTSPGKGAGFAGRGDGQRHHDSCEKIRRRQSDRARAPADHPRGHRPGREAGGDE